MTTTLKPELRTSVRKALVQQMARDLDDEKVRETSEEALKLVIQHDTSAKQLLSAVYGTANFSEISNRALGRLVAAVDRNRRLRTNRIPVRSN